MSGSDAKNYTDEMVEQMEVAYSDNPTRATAEALAVEFDKPVRSIIAKLSNMGIYKALFVIWWAEHEKKFAPGLYCPDMPTALYALALSAIGEAGAVGVCRHCGKPFIRSRGKQSYCNHKCQVAAGMVRYRKRLAKGRTKKSRNRR